jgi:hypothetical protein
VSRLVTLRRIGDLGQATLDLYESWPGEDAFDGRDRLVIADVSELLALLVGREIRASTTCPSRTTVAVRRAELSRQH